MLFSLILFNFLTTYLISSIFQNLSIFFIVYFSLIILNSEILSIFFLFNAKNILILSFIECIVVLMYFLLSKKRLYFPNIKDEIKKIKNAFKLDKYLIVLSFSFIFMMICFLILAFSTPPLEPDARMYHFVRIFSYIKQQSFAHFSTNQIRNIIMPINSEIVYSYFYLFKRNDIGYGFLSYFSSLTSIFSLYLIFKMLKISIRKRLFAILTLFSIGAIVVQIPSLQTDIVVGALLINSLYLFILYCNDKKISQLFFASLAYSIAFGVKTTAIMNFPTFIVILLSYLIIYKKKDKVKTISIFLLFLFINFLIFSSYNYILNYIQFGEFIAPTPFKNGHKVLLGLRQVIYNFIMLGFDFLGFRLFSYDERTIGAPVIGLLLFIPSVYYSIKLGIKKNIKYLRFNMVCCIVLILNYTILCFCVTYFPFSMRFIIPYIFLSSFCLVIFYSIKKFRKAVILISAVVMLFYAFQSQRVSLIKLFTLDKNNYKEQTLSSMKYEFYGTQLRLYNYFINNFNKEDRIAIIGDTLFYEVLQLMNFGYNIDILTLPEIRSEKIKNYDYVLTVNLYEWYDGCKFPDVSNKKMCLVDLIDCVGNSAILNSDITTGYTCMFKTDTLNKRYLKLHKQIKIGHTQNIETLDNSGEVVLYIFKRK